MKTLVPSPITNWLKAINKRNPEMFLACFAEDVIVIDIQREFAGKAAIKDWTDHEVMVGNVTEEIIDVREHYGDYIVVVEADGDFDKTNLPDPLLITNHFTLREGKIVKLICMLMKPAGTSLDAALAPNKQP